MNDEPPQGGAGPWPHGRPEHPGGPQGGGGPGYGGVPHGSPPYGHPPYGSPPYGSPQYGGQPYPPPYPGPYPVPPGAGGPPRGTSPDALVPFSFGDWFTKVIGTVRRSWRPLLVIQAVTLLPSLLLQLLLVPSGPAGAGDAVPSGAATTIAVGVVVLLGVLAVVASAVGAMAAVFVTVRDAARRPYTRAHVLAFVRNRAAPAIGWTVVAALVVAVGVGVLVAVLGPLLSLLPVLAGLCYAGTVLTALPGVVGVERAGIGRILALVHPRFFPTLGRVAVVALAASVAAVVLRLVRTVLSVASPAVGALVEVVLAVPIGVVGVAAAVVLYAENRFHENHAVHTPVLADEIDRP